MLCLRPLEEKNARRIVEWCAGREESFLRQWAGRGYAFPITAEQICDRLRAGALIFEADRDGAMVGTIEIISREGDSADVGRFLVDPALTGKGLGAEILRALMAHCRNALSLSELSLCVFDFNAPAYRCYVKCGFSPTGSVLRENGWRAITMQARL